MKRVTLELGGKSPNIILDDADSEKAIPLAMTLASINSGQASLAGTRLLVPTRRLAEVKQLVRKAVAAIKVGAPGERDTAIGPMASKTQYQRVQRYIALGIAEGAELVTGGEGPPDGLEGGYFVRFTVFANVTPDMTIAREEIFGPVLSILTCETEAEAITIANDTDYGLHAYVSASDLDRANRVAAQIVAGRVFMNGLYDIPEAPFGGFKQSGIGREFGTYGLEAYLEPKAIMGPQCQLYHAVAAQSHKHGVARAIAWIKQHYAEPMTIEDLAKTASMSASVLHRRFKALTVMSPLQTQKQLRLLEARKLLLGGNVEAATAAFHVGYQSPSQFSREYRRFFGVSPLRDTGSATRRDFDGKAFTD